MSDHNPNHHNRRDGSDPKKKKKKKKKMAKMSSHDPDHSNDRDQASPEERRKRKYREYETNPDEEIPKSTKKYRNMKEKIKQIERETERSSSDEDEMKIATKENEATTKENEATSSANDLHHEACQSVSGPPPQENSDESDEGSGSSESEEDILEEFLYSGDESEPTENRSRENASNDKDKQPLHESSRITIEECKLLMTAIGWRFNLPAVATESFIKLVDLCLPKDVLKSLYLFNKSIPKPEVIEYFYCHKCEVFLEFDERDNSKCSRCKKIYSKKERREQKKYFLYLPLKPQLVSFLESEAASSLKSPDEVDSSDITNADMYKDKRRAGIIKLGDLTVQWNLDGVNFCDNSSLNAWPISVMINELPYRVRKKHIFLVSLWYDTGKPPMNLYMRPFIDELRELATTGFTCRKFGEEEEKVIRVHSLCCVCDLCARCAAQNENQYNGEYGCPYCYQKGEIFEHVCPRNGEGGGRSRVYILQVNEPRTEEDYSLHVEEAVRLGVPVYGIKGPSVVSLLPFTKFTLYFPPEYMHALPIGIISMIAHSWIDSSNKDEGFYLNKAKRKLLEERILAIKPPTEVTRTPRKLFKKWNASDWRTFALYYYSCLVGILPDKYLKHFFLLIFGMNRFLQEKVSETDRHEAGRAFEEFVKLIPRLYGKRFCTANAHLLTHMEEFVRLFGALWAWSAFPFEGFNCILGRMFSGTQAIPEQIVKSFNKLRYVKCNSHVFSAETCNEKARKLFTETLNKCKVRNGIEFGKDLRCYGTPKKIDLSPVEQICIEQLIRQDIEPKCMSYLRFIHKRVLVHCRSYQRLTKRLNCIVSVGDREFIIIEKLVKVVTIQSAQPYYVIVGHKLQVLADAICANRDFSSNVFSAVVRETKEIVCYETSSIVSKCVGVPYREGDMCVTPIVNRFETD